MRWQGGAATLSWVEAGELREAPVPAVSTSEGLEFALPRERLAGRVTLVQAFTRRGRRFLDHTAPALLRMGTAPPAPAGAATPPGPPGA